MAMKDKIVAYIGPDINYAYLNTYVLRTAQAPNEFELLICS